MLKRNKIFIIALLINIIFISQINAQSLKGVHTANSDLYTITNSTVMTGKSMLDVLSLVPNVMVNKRKGLMIYRKDGVRVTMDNRNIEFIGIELTNYLDKFRGEDIVNIEVIASANSTYSADATGGIIRITTNHNLSNNNSDKEGKVSDSEKIILGGKVVDQDNLPIPFCNVTLSDSKTSGFITGGVTDENGMWQLNTPQGNYQLKVSFLGYEPLEQMISATKTNRDINISLKETGLKLEELTVVAKKKITSPNSNIYLLANSNKTIGKNTLEVLSLTTGITVNPKNGIKIYGKSGVKIEVNDREIELQGKDLLTYLANINGEDIASLEVITTADATHSAEAVGGVIKIRTKKTQDNGYDLSVGIKSQLYKTSYMGLSPDVDIKAHINNFNLYANLAYNNIGEREDNTENSVYNSALHNNVKDRVTTFSNMLYKTTRNQFLGRIGGIYTINDRHSIGLNYDGSFGKDIESSHSPSMIENSFSKEHYWVDYYSNIKMHNSNLSLNYIFKTNDQGSMLSFNADYINSANNANDHTELYSDDSVEDNNGKTKNDTNSSQQVYTVSLNYKLVANKTFIFEFGGKLTSINIKNKMRYYNWNGADWGSDKSSDWIVDTESTDDYTYTENIIAGYFNGTFKRKKWDLTAGIRYEYMMKDTKSLNFSDLTRSNNYGDLFPTASLTYNINEEKGHNISLNYKYGILRPSFDQLLPYTTQQSLSTYILGNPLLKPSYSSSVGANLLLFGGLYFGVDYTHNTDLAELTFYSKDPESVALYAIYDNIPKINSYMLMSYIPVPICDWFYIGFELSGGKKDRTYSKYTDNIWQYYAAFDSEIKIAKNWIVELSGNYLNKEFYGNMLLHDYYNFDLSLKRSFFNNRLQCAINGTNIFGSKRKLKFQNENVTRDVVSKYSVECSRFGISVRYNFGKQNIKASKVNVGNEEERSRF